MTETGRLPLLLSIDLDNTWSYLKTQGDVGWKTFPGFLDRFVDHALPLLEQHNLRITFFSIGQDAALEKNHSALKAIADAGHEIGNHSFSHEPWMHLQPDESIAQEISQAATVIEQATGYRPVGYRGPAYSCSERLLKILQRQGYLYDASVFPTFLGPLARWYFFARAGDLDAAEKQQRAALFGKFSDGFQSLRPSRHALDDGELLELPVSTLPWLKFPFHQTYQNYLAGFWQPLGRWYGRLGFGLCRLSSVSPSFLLHPVDFVGVDHLPELAFLPGMKLDSHQKLAIMADILDYLDEHFEITGLRAFCEASDTRQWPLKPLT